jgi:phosphodiesterase/alkaline phosphatase D-like protein
MRLLSRRSFLALLAAMLAQVRGWAQLRPAVDWVWSGACTADGVTIKAHARPGAMILLVASPLDTAAVSSTVTRAAVADANGVATFVLGDLEERTRYGYSVSTEGTAALEGTFRTFSNRALSFRAVFASCAGSGSRSAVFTQMRAQQPDLFFHMGDMHYRNIARNLPALYARAYQDVLTSPTQSQLYRNVPIAYMWDDHDYGPDNSDGTSPSREAALASYRVFVPHYPMDARSESTIHQAFTIGRVRVIMTDTRSARSSPRVGAAERTMLGERQLAWLLEELEDAADAPLVLWVNTIPWITKRNEATDEGWAPYDVERRTIADAIVRLRLSDRLVMLSGDAHMLAIDDGTNSEYSLNASQGSKGFVVAHAAPMDRWPRIKGGNYSHGQVAANGQYGVLDVVDEGERVQVTIQGWRGGSPVPGMRLSFTCADGRCTAPVVTPAAAG